MPHIHTEHGQHDHTASAYIFRTDFSAPKVMLHLHKILGSYMQFGGHIELDETPWQTITHELLEESGYDLDQLQILQPQLRLKKLTGAVVVHPQPVSHITHVFNSEHFHTDVCYAMLASSEPRHVIGAKESSDIRLFTREEIIQLPNDKIIENIREIILYMFDDILGNWEKISPTDFK